MGCYRRAKLALDAVRGFTARIVPKVVAKEPISRAFSTESSTLASNKDKFSGFSWCSSLSQKSIPQLGFTRRTRYTSPVLDSAKRYYYVDRNSVHHFKPRGPRKWFQSPRNVFIVVLVGSGVFITVYFGNLETIPYTKRTHFVILSKALEKKMGESQFEQLKASFKGKILPAIHPDSVRVRLISKDIIEALQRGLRHEVGWTDLEYASDRFEPAHEGSGHDTLMALKDVGEEVKKWSREDEILDDEWIQKSRKTGQERGTKTATSHLDHLNWEVLVVDEPVVNAFCLPGGKIVVFTGLLKHFRSDAEIATIIGHEVGHAVARHSAEGITKNLWFAILQLILYQFVMPDVVNTMSNLFLKLPFSRRMEIEADHIGLLLVASAGYDPRVAPTVYEKLGKISGESALRDYLSTHPSGKKRAQLLAQAKIMEEALAIYRDVRAGRGVEGRLSSSRLLKHFRSDAEIATIIGHEVGHAVARHSAEGITKNLWFAIMQLIRYQFVMPDAVNAMSNLFLRLPFSRRVHLGTEKNKKRYHPVVATFLSALINFSRLHDYMTELACKHKTYRVLNLFTNFVFTTDPANVEYILKTNFANYGKGLYLYNILSDGLGSGIFAVDGEKWVHLRKVASNELSTKAVRDFSGAVFKNNGVKLARIISEAATSDQAIDIQDLFMKAALDSIVKVLLGIEVDTMYGTNEEATRFSNAFDVVNEMTLYRCVDFSWKIKKLLDIGSEAMLRKNLKVVDEFVYNLIKSKTETVPNSGDDPHLKRRDIVSRLLESRETDPKYLRDMIFSLVVAGKDTTASTLSWFIYMICKHPHIQEKIAQELREATNMKDNSSIDELADNLTEEALDKMQYLVAALTETTRLYPAVPLNAKICSCDDTWPDGFSVKKGDLVGYHAYGMGRMKFLWGDDAEEFRPERWLDENGVFKQESSFKFTAFSAGPRICVGKEFAYRQMMIFSAVLLGSYILKLRDENKVANYRTKFTHHIDGGLYVQASPRFANASP
ncbi:Hypothetical predicted protein [Prunus dulcis]|uniref:Peptidase M48 domain-containing protein n=1 Tax=Prunus dulcis TaxID=3755 RepID=A0A5E4E862_PRUDU|nr:Hypothetical predicted protein [Prunus dulcis]